MKLAFMAPGYGEVLLVFLAILLLFGAKKLPGLARALGRSLGEFKKGREEGSTKGGDKDEHPSDAEDDGDGANP